MPPVGEITEKTDRPGACCSYFLPADAARLLVGISVGIGSSWRRKPFQIQLVHDRVAISST